MAYIPAGEANSSQSQYIPAGSRTEPKRIGQNIDLGTSAGLLELANQKGYGNEARNILAGRGEKPKEIFSGGFISDIFDTLNALQYGVTGIIKGKGFALF